MPAGRRRYAAATASATTKAGTSASAGRHSALARSAPVAGRALSSTSPACATWPISRRFCTRKAKVMGPALTANRFA
jgi:hypothetical protein